MTQIPRALVLALVLVACDVISGPTPICACDPVTVGLAVLYGEVVDPDGHAVENSRVNAHLIADAPCPAPPSTLGLANFALTGGTGRFRYALAWSNPTTKCWAVWASPPAASGHAASDTVLVVVNYTSGLSDSTTVRLQLR
jgi:hypothetical protein